MPSLTSKFAKRRMRVCVICGSYRPNSAWPAIAAPARSMRQKSSEKNARKRDKAKRKSTARRSPDRKLTLIITGPAMRGFFV